MALLAAPVASRLGGTTFGGSGAAAVGNGSGGRATTDLVGAFAASSLLCRRPPFPLPRPLPFPWPPPPPPFLRPPPLLPPPANIAWPAWPALDPFFLFQESRWCRCRTVLMVSSRPILSLDTRFLASTSYSAGKASIKIVYSM